MATERIAAIIGDFYHRAEPMLDALNVTAGSLGLSVDPVPDPLRLDWAGLGSYRGLVIARENRVAPNENPARLWATEEHEAALAAFVKSGGALAVLHAGLASYRIAGPWFETVRGGFLFHPSEHPSFRVTMLETTHPALAGCSEVELKDEMYFVRVDSSRTTRLLEVVSPDYGVSCAGWAHAIGKGRVFCLTPGHTNEVLANPGYRKLLAQGMRWVLGMA